MSSSSSPSSSTPLPFRQSIAGAMDAAIGRHGLTAQELEARLARLAPALEELKEDYRLRRLPLLRLPEESDDIAPAQAAIERLCRGAHTLIFFGTGGSSLGGQALAQLAGWNIPGVADQSQRLRPRTRFYDNLDAETLERVLAHFELSGTRFVVTSKSGNTPETLVQMIAALQAVAAAGLADRVGDLFLALTEPAVAGRSNGLRKMCEARGIPTLEHHTGIGGRYSVLSNVGLLPALARGLDVARLRRGAREVMAQLLAAASPGEVPAAVGAALSVGLAEERGIRIQAMMPYSDRLGSFAQWFVQLWAESLGKNGLGTTPLACLGPVDQHSQLQLFMDGPREHLLTVLRVASAGRGPHIAADLAAEAGLPEMAGRAAGDLVAAQGQGVPEALARAGRPVRAFDIGPLDEHVMGALLMHFMLETILAGRLLGVDPFDQPAVELGKKLSREHLMRAR